MEVTEDTQEANSGSEAASRQTGEESYNSLGGLSYWQICAPSGGLTYVRQRWLENTSGQWLSVDPVATAPTYGYGHNSPTMRTDPSGTQAGGPSGAPSADAVERTQEAALASARRAAAVQAVSAPLEKMIANFTQRAISAGQDKPYPFPATDTFGWVNNFFPGWNEFQILEPADQIAIANAILKPMEINLRNSARRNSIPVWLLSNVILTEMLDSHDERQYAKRSLSIPNTSIGPG